MASTNTKTFPHPWSLVSSLTSLSSNTRITELVLSDPFLDRWITFRDSIPLSPGMTFDFHEHSKDWIDKLASDIYKDMASLRYCTYDSPSDFERLNWKPAEHFQCLIYQSARHLAKKPFSVVFELRSIRAEGGKARALMVLQGLIMIAHNLVYTYIHLTPAPGSIVSRIEEARPTPDPAKSPIPEVRVKHALKNVDVAELSERILQAPGDDQKEWLTGLIASNSELRKRVLGSLGAGPGAGAGVKVEGEEDAGGKKKRKREEVIEVDDDVIVVKAKKTESG